MVPKEGDDFDSGKARSQIYNTNVSRDNVDLADLTVVDGEDSNTTTNKDGVKPKYFGFDTTYNNVPGRSSLGIQEKDIDLRA